jgi:DNA-binding CsgD family transcriptional regulator/PAS domain-containing protein
VNVSENYIVERRSGRDRRISDDRRGHDDRRAAGDRRRESDFGGEGDADRRGAGRRGAVALDLPFRPGDAGGRRGSMHGAASTLLCEMFDRLGPDLVEVIAGFYDAGFDAKTWSDVLNKLKNMIHADVCAVASHGFDGKGGRLDHSIGIDALYVSAYTDFYARDNVWLHDRDRFASPGAVWTGQDLLADARLVETDFYKFWLRPQDLYHHLFGVLEASDRKVVYLMFSRARDKGSFWRDDVGLLRHLLPTLRRGIEAGARYQRLQRVQHIALDTLDALPIGVMLLNVGGHIVAANRSAREILQSEDGLHNSADGLGVRLAGGRLKLRDLIVGGPSRNGEAAGEIQGFSIDRGAERQAVTLLLSPVQDFSQARDEEEPAAVLFVADPERATEVDPLRLHRIYGLSRAESRVAALLATGMRLEAVAQTLGLTYETVRKHLKQIFAKTGTSRQALLVRTLSLGPCGLRL